ncbi:hypothetical protein AB2L28_09080 [Kineococcus sp. TBRC 1896]|uniref:MYXO-CTERM domain-containing protein n=1 Tax=Kineococcus mangrovi TaxID=1660183 RepID=A0ABV4I148_9ACTN
MTVVKWEETGTWDESAPAAPPPRTGRREVAAAALSVLWPGLGHAYLGRTAAAVALVLAQVLLVVLTVLPGAWRVTLPAWVALTALAAVGAWRAARHAPGEQPG